MIFAKDIEFSLAGAVAMVNSAEGADGMMTIEDLDAYYQEFCFTGSRRRTKAELREVRTSRGLLRHLLLAPEEAGVAAVNAVLRDNAALPQVVRHDGLGWHIHASPPSAPLATRILVETAIAMAEVHRIGEGDRLRVCEGADCERVILDLSKNRSRRFCQISCRNRRAVAAYRDRKRDRGDTPAGA